MAASSFSASSPFLTYLTVFKSRLANANIVVPLSGFAYQSPALLARRTQEKLSERVTLDVNDPSNLHVFKYLLEKHLVGSASRESGRYRDFTLHIEGGALRASDRKDQPVQRVSVFRTDIWLAHPYVRSTVGVPTPENVGEVLELCYQLKIISKTKSTWTPAGHLEVQLRQHSGALGFDVRNPMVLGLETPVLLRQVLQEDGIMLRELLGQLGPPGSTVTRDQIASKFLALAEAALKRVEGLNPSPPVMKEGREFLRLLKQTTARRVTKVQQEERGPNGGAKKGGPGVFEHRTAPRLEWLVDFGVLSKDGLPKNGFTYSVTSDAGQLLQILDRNLGERNWPDNSALEYWREATFFAPLRGLLPRIDVRGSLLLGYGLMKRPIGPAPIREVCFGAAVVSPTITLGVEALSSHLVEWAKEESRVTLSGGRFTRAPEFVHISSDLVGR